MSQSCLSPFRFLLLTARTAVCALGVAVGCAEASATTLPTYPHVAYADHHWRTALDLYIPTDACGPYPVVIFIHGGGWLSGDKDQVAPYVDNLLARGFAVAAPNYRLSNTDTFPACVHDLKTAVRWLREHAAEYDLDPDRFGAFGVSAGGHLVDMLATSGGMSELEAEHLGSPGFSSRIQAGAAMGGPTDLAQLGAFHGSPTSAESLLIGFSIPEILDNAGDPAYAPWLVLLDLANPAFHASADDAPLYIGHGANDLEVPASQAQLLFDALDAAGAEAELRIVPGQGHALSATEVNAMFAFLEDHLAPGDVRRQFTFNGSDAGDRLGMSVAVIGDVDRDDVPDFALGAPFSDRSEKDAGRVVIRSGATGGAIKSFYGKSRGDAFGWSVADAGDVNNDGYQDVIIGAPRADDHGSRSGRVIVRSGKNWSLLHTFRGERAGDEFGYSVSGAGDVNGDGYDDVVIGAPFNDANGSKSGRAYIYNGRTGALLRIINGKVAGDQFGYSVANAGRITGDGRDDVVIGAPGSDVSGSNSGSAAVYGRVGSSWKRLHLFAGSSAGDAFGHAVCSAGDVNGDGHDDVLIGAPRSDQGAVDRGSAAIFSGVSGEVVAVLAPETDEPGQWFGWSVAAMGDADSDTLSDVAVSAPFTDSCRSNSGRVTVHSGATGAVIEAFAGGEAGSYFGRSIAGGIDRDGDSRPELLIGSDLHDNSASANLGRVTCFEVPD